MLGAPTSPHWCTTPPHGDSGSEVPWPLGPNLKFLASQARARGGEETRTEGDVPVQSEGRRGRVLAQGSGDGRRSRQQRQATGTVRVLGSFSQGHQR